MQAAMIRGPRQVVVTEVENPRPGPRDAVVRVEAAGICGTDVHIYEGDFVSTYPLIPGHEFAGVVEEVGKELTGFRPGDRVAVDPSVYCERCHFCKQNLQNHCEHWNALGVTASGAFAEFVRVPEPCLFPLGELTFAQGAFAEPLACVIYGLERARPSLGDSVLIFGAGPIGLQHLLVLKGGGAGMVTVVDRVAERLDKARSLGADHVVLAGDDLGGRLREIAPYGFPLVIDATGVPRVVEEAIAFVKNHGKLLIFGVCPTDSRIQLNPFDVYRRDLQILGSFALRKTFQAALQMLQRGDIDVDSLIGLRLPLTEFPHGLELMRTGKAPLKIHVTPGKS